METAAFLGLLGLGYMASNTFKKTEGFANVDSSDSTKTPPGAPTVPGSPRQVNNTYDVMFDLPNGTSLPFEPNPSKLRGLPVDYAVLPPSSLPVQTNPIESASAKVQLRPDRREDATPRSGFISPLTGIEFKPGDFKHNNMVPFYRGSLKQNMMDTANNATLDSYTGTGKYSFEKREMGPMFEPTKEPMGNPHGLESITNFLETRTYEPNNRANERPVESIRVGRGLNQGYTHMPSGGFQQQAGEEFIIHRMARTDDLRTANNPKISYETPVVSGSHFVGTGSTAETIGDVRKYMPDRFYLNENGERNFVTTGADLKPAVRSTQVLKHTARPETTTSYTGTAGQTEGRATYTIGSTRTPLVKQMGSWGYRNADLTSKFNKNVDAEQNDYGKAGVEIRPNERYYTGERVHATNVSPDAREGAIPLQDGARATRAEELIQNPRSSGNFNALGAGLPEKATSYDPNDIARTTIKETTIDNDWIGMAAPTSVQPKLKVYDPNDVARTTIKETTVDNDWIGMIAPTSAQPKLKVYDPNDVARTTIKETTIDNDWIGMAAPTSAQPKLKVYDPNDVARTTIKETTIDNDWIGMAAPVDAQPRLTVYDPNDVARTTIRETTEDSDYIGVAAPANGPQKLTVYDPDDVARVTGRNTLADWDTYRNMGSQENSQHTVRLQDKVRHTQKAAISARSAYTGIAESTEAKAAVSRDSAKAMRHYAQKERIAQGRTPMGSSVKIFNGEDNVNLQYRRLVSDSVNNRDMSVDRVLTEPTSVEVIGVQRPRAALRLDVSAARNEPIVVESLQNNPYNISLSKIAAGGGRQ